MATLQEASTSDLEARLENVDGRTGEAKRIRAELARRTSEASMEVEISKGGASVGSTSQHLQPEAVVGAALAAIAASGSLKCTVYKYYESIRNSLMTLDFLQKRLAEADGDLLNLPQFDRQKYQESTGLPKTAAAEPEDLAKATHTLVNDRTQESAPAREVIQNIQGVQPPAPPPELVQASS